MGREYTCEECGGTFETRDDWTDADAEAEMLANFGEARSDDDVVLCDPCYQELLPRLMEIARVGRRYA